MSKLIDGNKKVEKVVVSGYKIIEDAVVGGYKKIEDTFVSGYKKIEDKFVDTFLTPSDADETSEIMGETLHEKSGGKRSD